MSAFVNVLLVAEAWIFVGDHGQHVNNGITDTEGTIWRGDLTFILAALTTQLLLSVTLAFSHHHHSGDPYMWSAVGKNAAQPSIQSPAGAPIPSNYYPGSSQRRTPMGPAR